MTQTADLIHKMAEFFKSEEYFEKGEDARLELSPDDVRCMNEIIKACGNAISRDAVFNTIYKMELSNWVKDELWNEMKMLPSVIPSRRYGHWKKIEPYPLQMHEYECSECFHETDDNTENFCSMCGADIRVCKDCDLYNGKYIQGIECKAKRCRRNKDGKCTAEKMMINVHGECMASDYIERGSDEWIWRVKHDEKEATKSKDRCMFCKEMFDLFCAKSGRNVTYDEFSKPPYKPEWCQGRTPSNDYHD